MLAQVVGGWASGGGAGWSTKNGTFNYLFLFLKNGITVKKVSYGRCMLKKFPWLCINWLFEKARTKPSQPLLSCIESEFYLYSSLCFQAFFFPRILLFFFLVKSNLTFIDWMRISVSHFYFLCIEFKVEGKKMQMKWTTKT